MTDRTARMWTRIRHLNKTDLLRQASWSIAIRTREPEQESWNRRAGTGESEQESQNRKPRTGDPEQ
jgi:hypothetical protein